MPDHDLDRDLSLFVPPKYAQAVLAQAADVMILLDDMLRVERVFCSREFERPKISQWRGKLFRDCVAPDSQSKLQHLFGENSAAQDDDARWRHLNLSINGNPDLPLLLKFFSFDDDEHGVMQMLCARDLRPLLKIQKRFQREVDLLGTERSKLEQKLRFLQ